jgi:predicted Zn-dependent protease
MRRFRALPALALATLTLTACPVNPATGERQLMLISEAQEIEMGRQGAQQVEVSLGLYDNPDLQEYVSQVGLDLAANSEKPDLPWSFKIVDDLVVNAFALPGGFIFVTRGILTHFNSEAELAGVLGHEIGHVTARHSAEQISRAQAAQLGVGVGYSDATTSASRTTSASATCGARATTPQRW